MVMVHYGSVHFHSKIGGDRADEQAFAGIIHLELTLGFSIAHMKDYRHYFSMADFEYLRLIIRGENSQILGFLIV